MNERDAVTAGAAWLDKVKPGWNELINENNLDMGHCELCIIGQLFDDYWKAKASLFPNTNEENKTQWAIRHGFYGMYEESGWVGLGQEWIAEIKRRKEKVKA